MGRWIALFLLGALFACGGADKDDQPFITIATTTSPRNSGLTDHLLPQFTETTGIAVRVVAVGTGRAIQLGRSGDVDAVLVHHERLETQFVADGYGIERIPVMYNEFIVVGPRADPLGIGKAKDAVEAFQLLAQGTAPFVSRGDQSGTHLREIATWKMAGIDPVPASGTWYREAGRGMGATLNTAVGMNAYCLTDSGTWLKFKNAANHAVLLSGDARLFNPYTFMVVSHKRHPHVKQALGRPCRAARHRRLPHSRRAGVFPQREALTAFPEQPRAEDAELR